MRRLTQWAIPLIVATSGGCATAVNVSHGGGQPYGGVTMTCVDFCGGGQNGGFAAAGVWPFWLLDKPLSLVGDTITLPFTLWASGTVDHWITSLAATSKTTPAEKAPATHDLQTATRPTAPLLEVDPRMVVSPEDVQRLSAPRQPPDIDPGIYVSPDLLKRQY